MATIHDKMTAIANEIRTLSGTTNTMGLDAMATHINGANVNVNSEATLIAQIATALEGKAQAISVNLNFQLKAYSTEEVLLADVPSENTIGIVTNNEITGYCFSSESPTGIVEGKVWIVTGKDSSAAFYLLDNKIVRVYPISVKQYVSGAWVDKEAKTYQGGKWVDWLKHMYKNGDECTADTGGWITQTETNGRATKNADHIALSYVSSSMTGAIVDTANKIDVTNYSTLVFELSATAGTSSFGCVAGLTTAPDLGAGWNYHNEGGGNYVAAIGTRTSVSRSKMSLDISDISGLYYIEIGSVYGSVNIYNVYLQ